MGKQCADAKLLGEPHEVAPGPDGLDEADGKLPFRCPLHRRQRKRWRDKNSARRKRAREAKQPEPPNDPWRPTSLRRRGRPVSVAAEERDYLYDLLADLDLAARKIRQLSNGAGSTRLKTLAGELTSSLDALHGMLDDALPRDDPLPPVRARTGATTLLARR